MSYIKSTLKGILMAIQSVEIVVCSVGLLITTVLVFLFVVNRYFGIGIMGILDLALYCFIFFMFVAATVATWRETHVKVDALPDMFLKGKPRATSVHRVLMAFIAIALLCLFLPEMYNNMIWALKFPEYGTLIRWFNMSWLRVAAFFSFVVVLIHLLVIGGRDIGNLTKIWRATSRE